LQRVNAARQSAGRPIVGIAVAYAAGTWLGLGGRLSLAGCVAGAAAAWLLAAAACAFAARARRLPSGRARTVAGSAATVLIHAGVFFAACALALLSSSRSGRDSTASLLAGQRQCRGEFEGTVLSDPDDGPVSDGGRLVRHFTLAIDRARAEGGDWVGVRERVQVLWHGRRAGRKPEYGERWLLAGTLWTGRQRPWGPTYGLRVYGGGSRLLAPGHGGGLRNFCYAARQSAADRLQVGIRDVPESGGVVSALVLGYRAQLSEAREELFIRTGTLHVFAISGLHVVVVCGLLVFLLRALGVSRPHWAFLLVPFVVLYTVATGASASAVRACLMALVFFLAPLLGRKADSLAALAFSAVVLLILRPEDLADVGFILSFAAVIGLIALTPLIAAPLRRLWQPDPLRLQPEPGTRRFLRAAARHLGDLWAVSCAAWLVSTPLTAYFFGRFSPIALVSNLIVVPLSSLVLIAGALSVVLGSCVERLADIFNHANLFLVGVMLRLTELLSAVPWGSLTIPPPPAWAVWAWYAVLGGAVIAARRLDKSRAITENPRS
jgi:ComEC/Rec2-related protein